MKFRITLVFAFLALLISVQNLFAQERYRIVYDYQTDKLGVFHLDKKNQIDDTLKNAVLKRNSLVELKLKNINPFAIEVRPEIVEENFNPTDLGFNPSSLLAGISAFNDNGLGLNVKNLPTDNIFTRSGTGDGIDEITAGDQETSRGSRGDEFEEDYGHLKSLYTGVEEIKSKLIGNLINPNLSKKQIMANAIKPSVIFEDNRLAGTQGDFYTYLAKLEEILSEDSEGIVGLLYEISHEEEELMEDETLSRGQRVSIRLRQSQIEEAIHGIKSVGDSKLADLRQIKSLFAALEASSFEKTTDYVIEADRANINLDFKQSTFSNDLDESGSNQETLKNRRIKIFAKGGIKVNTSIAITLNNYRGRSKDFFLIDNEIDGEDDVIGSDDNDFYTPNLSTMINFYPVLGESFNFGGTFGVSIPISTADETPNGINFLLGPSFFFGSESRVSFSGGLAYGPVRRLKNGLNTADTTALGESDLTKTVYDVGFFFGVSFSLFELNKN
ncbi:hypothetical protein [Flagellimonas onchidii]|uniref:hypothetical protein n=1 Tax=Flagellimonas onchidii TaxID=2562684 RepID=UPI0010A5F2BB|nr:hypothetical protein [Allomuricauda onchidii]